MGDSDSSVSPRASLVIDANIYLSSLMNSRAASQLSEACFEGTLEAVYSQHLLNELEDVYSRDKFRKWFTLEEGAAMVAAIELAGTEVADRLPGDLPLVCRDPDDNYLFAIAEDSDTRFIVTGDKEVLKTNVPWAAPITLKQSLDLLADEHEWGTYLIGGDIDRIWESIRASGNEEIFGAVELFSNFVHGIQSKKISKKAIRLLAVPGTERGWVSGIDEILNWVAGRGFGTHPDVISPDLVGVKLVPDVGRAVLVSESPRNFRDILCLTMERCPDLLLADGTDPLGIGGWRMHSIGDRFLTPDMVRPPTDPLRRRAAKAARKRLTELDLGMP